MLQVGVDLKERDVENQESLPGFLVTELLKEAKVEKKEFSLIPNGKNLENLIRKLCEVQNCFINFGQTI